VRDVESAESLPGWDLNYVQVTRGTLAGSFRAVNLGGMQIVEERYAGVTLNEFGHAPSDTYMFSIPHWEGACGRINAAPWTDGGLYMTRSDRDLDAVVPPGKDITIVVSQGLLKDHVAVTQHLDLENWLSRRSILSTNMPLGRRIATLASEVATASLSSHMDDRLRKAARESVMEALADVVACNVSVRPPSYREISRPLIVRRSREFVRHHIHEPLQVIDLCRHLGVSRRALQSAFEDMLGVSPSTYVRLLRLNGARSSLLHPAADLQIKDVVRQWGFWHLSRFSSDYKSLYGELPSQTLQRVRRGYPH
jgi:AraC family ethanolamine operon transcriptional activator